MTARSPAAAAASERTRADQGTPDRVMYPTAARLTFPRDPPRPRALLILVALSAKPRRQRTHDVTAALSSLAQTALRAPSFSSRPVTRRPGGSGHTRTLRPACAHPSMAALARLSPRLRFCASALPSAGVWSRVKCR